MNRSLRIAPLVMAVAACGGTDLDRDVEDDPLGTASQASTVCANGDVLEGVDVSAYQPGTDWIAVKASGRSFAIVKATENLGYVNPYFADDWDGLAAAGMIRGPYHFFHPDSDPIAQADHFIDTVGAIEDGDLSPVCDLESTGGVGASTIASNLKKFLARVEERSGRVPIIYTSPAFWNSTLGAPDGFDQYLLWIASWKADCPNLPSGWSSWPLWQYADNGSVPGIDGPVDLDRFNGGATDLAAFTHAKAPPAEVGGNDSITVVTWNGDLHAEAFARTTGGELVHAASKGSSDNWSSVEPLAGGAECGFTASFWAPPQSYSEIWAPRANGATAHLWWADGSYGGFEDFGGKGLSHLSALSWPDAHDEVFALGADGAIWHRVWQLDAGDWSEWASVGGRHFVTGVSSILAADGHAEIFATAADGSAWHAGASDAGVEPWQRIEGEITSRPIPVRWPDDHLEVFARGADGHLVHAANDGGWSAFTPLDPATAIWGEPSAIMNVAIGGAPAGAEVFARDPSGHVVHVRWDGAQYGTLERLGDALIASDPLGFVRGEGHAEVFAIGDNGRLVRTYDDPIGGWSAWSAIGGSGLDGCAQAPPSYGSNAAFNAVDESDDTGAGCAVAPAPKGLPWAASIALLAALSRRRRKASK